ncbi:E3 ubiquitin-protein ligase RNF169-like [Diorhabda sublineata]|uniref:E3 ubiquitin-protein ligase RNF169-like n=1 Tax=Diorhabda sublineata TaxID=1163346 RepID=UPI0024E0B43F|nr:E3 ubiquitin-protein ligase RNF169-like [Diorhabda sublineata]
MAPKRTTKYTKLLNSTNYSTLVLNDVLCPICRSILIEPVSLPCNHDFCLVCFENTMENANLVCPLCRMRVGSWLRKTKKENSLINTELWKYIRDKFPKHVNNKLNGIDENIIEEQRDIVVAYPGEIRKEYEIQKQKEDEEQRKKREAEIKASEELIKKLKAEEDSRRVMLEEKMRLDEAIAKKLAEELAPKPESTPKIKHTPNKLGPMDKFLQKDNGNLSSNHNNFVNKEYTCRVLCLDNNTKQTNIQHFSPKIHKKIQQIQKIVDLDLSSDSSDCIESEMRYFKPIDHRLNPPTQKISPIKITPKKIKSDTNTRIVSPSGTINFNSNILESAFARFSLDLKESSDTPASIELTLTPLTSKRPSLKRSLYMVNTDCASTEKKFKPNSSVSPTLDCDISPVFRKKLFGETKKSVTSVENPFYGFGKGDEKESKVDVRKNGYSFSDKLKEEQEKADLEFAKRLQKEFDKGRYTRSSRSMHISKRQSTLDKMIKSTYRIK